MKDSPRRNAANLPLLIPAALVLGLLAGCDTPQEQGQVQGQAQQRAQPLHPSSWTLTKPQPATAPRVAEPFPIQPRNYPEQTNTTPVGWVSPEERAAQEKAAEERRAAERKAAEEQATQAAAAPPPQPARNTRGSQQGGNRSASASPANSAAPNTAQQPARQTSPRNATPAPATAARPAETMTASASPNTGRWHAHLASHRSEEAAINDWQARLKANPQVYTELEPAILWVDLPNRGSYARLVAGNYASKAEADAACAKITGPGRYCTAVIE
ncbi:SPOR domain-containing protein [Ferrovibrio sp.]|uniref:SPOR domain-containing protein n=1 Tax=Ferrovibrio sp. TaxID=1917215 RepID=UPI003D2A72B0